MPVTRFCRLPELGVVAATGADARSFLQGQLTCDLSALERHPGQLAAACNPQGRVLELMRLAAIADGVLLVLRRALIPALLIRLPKYVLRARVRISDRSDELRVAGLLDAADPGGWLTAATATGLTALVAGARRLLLVGAAGSHAPALASVAEASPADWEFAAVAEGEPDIFPPTAGHWIPQMLNLDRLGAISFSKGCYTGQEIVARTEHLGRVKRRMMRYVGAAGTAPAPGQALYCGAATTAQIVRIAVRGDGTHLLAVVGVEQAGSPLGLAEGGREFAPAEASGT